MTEDGWTRWMCEHCWVDKNFTHYGQTSNKTIVKYLKDEHGITQEDATNVFQFQITPTTDNAISIIPTRLNWELLGVNVCLLFVCLRRGCPPATHFAMQHCEMGSLLKIYLFRAGTYYIVTLAEE